MTDHDDDLTPQEAMRSAIERRERTRTTTNELRLQTAQLRAERERNCWSERLRASMALRDPKPRQRKA